jgi:hypothetical protein
MTDRLKGIYVAFDEDIRDDDAEPIIQAIRQIRHVLSVTPHVTRQEAYVIFGGVTALDSAKHRISELEEQLAILYTAQTEREKKP